MFIFIVDRKKAEKLKRLYGKKNITGKKKSNRNHKKSSKSIKAKDDSWKKHKKEAESYVKKIISEVTKTRPFSYNRITIRNQKTRWGSCSSKKNLNFNYRIKDLPYDLAEYLVVHELCHLKQMNHSKKYWECVEKLVPDFKDRKKRLKEIKFSNK